jgi:hypothetical protein
MSTVTTVEVLDLLTIRECIEILVDRRTGRDRIPSLPPAVVDHLGATHVRPRAWIDEAKDLLRQALIAGEVGLYASRKIRDGPNAVSDAFVRIPSENLDRSIAFHIALPSDVLRVRVHDCLAPFNGSEIRIRRSELQAWLGRIASFLIEPNFAGGHLDDRNQDAPINNLDWRSTPFANCIHYDRRPTSRSGRSRDRRLQRPTRDTAHPSVCDRRSGPLTGYQNVAPHESNLPLRRIKAAGRVKPADSTSNRLFGRELNNAPAAPSTFGTISSDRGKGTLQFTRLAGSGSCHPNSAELPPGQCAERHP